LRNYDTNSASFSGRSKTQGAAPPPHDILKAQLEEWSRKLQSIEASGVVSQDSGQAMTSKEKEDALAEVARAFDKLLHIFGQNA
jgi:hypothetical protein